MVISKFEYDINDNKFRNKSMLAMGTQNISDKGILDTD